ncbi:MAG TPA: serine/threonine-protein kinase [Phycisphaerae bacterium]|nr:serine/threonine-protein kinase [Phycisphaerae bacterium]HNU44740.1 serine/threonine-protein kinase [Phycisphaerae bacterium]
MLDMNAPEGTDPSSRERSLVAYVLEQLRAARRSGAETLATGKASGPPSDATASIVERLRVPRPSWTGSGQRSLQSLLADSLPNYEILRKVSGGGQGIVYEAIQRSTKQRVALKVLKAGPLADDAMRARFEREVEILVRLNHPNIVRVIDCGVVVGCSYYVMDFVPGRELDRYVSAHDLPVRDTLQLFAKTCDAVSAAHLNGVIHRDLKPNNILVDAGGEPYLLDFGFAKVGDAKEGPSAQYISMPGQFFGALAWASPEQVELGTHYVDTRSDVYSLGVILFQLLTRRFPYDVSGTFEDIKHSIRFADPARPSGLRKELHGEVEAILLRCLHKEPSQRYETAGALAQDVRRFLAGEPIMAPPPGNRSWYMFKKTLARHRIAASVIVGYVVLVSLAAGVIGAFWYDSWHANRQADLMLAQGVEQTKHADVEGLLQTLQSYEPLIESGGVAALTRLSAQINSAEDQLARRISTLLDCGQSYVVVDLIARRPELTWSLHRLGNSGRGAEVLAQFRKRLEQRLLIPPPAGFGQATRDSIGLLQDLDPRNPRATAAKRQLDKLTSDFVKVVDETFSTQQPRSFPSNVPGCKWQIKNEEFPQRPEVVEEERALAVYSNPSNSCSVTLDYALPAGAQVVVVTCDVNVQPAAQDATPSRAHACDVHLVLEGGEFAGLSCRDGRLGWCASSASGGVRGYGGVLEYNKPYRVELRYFSDTPSMDVLVDDHFLVEGQPHVEKQLPTGVSFGAGYGCTVLVDNITIRAGATALKRELGPRVPLIESDELALRPARFVPVLASRALTADMDGDGQAELVTSSIDGEPAHVDKSGAALVGHVRACKFVGRDFRPAELDTLLELPARQPSLLGGLQNWVFVLDAPHVLALRAGAEINNGEPVAHDCDGARTMAPYVYPDGNPGFVVGAAGSDHNRNLRFFAATHDHLGFQPTGNIISPIDEGRRRSDIFSLALCDINGDASEDILIGWGPYHGYGPGVVTPSSESTEKTVTRIGPPDARYGNTRLCVHRAADGESYLVVASAHEPRLAGGEFADLDASATSGGVRMWRVSDLRNDITVKPCWTLDVDACADVDARAVTTGELCGQNVFVAAWLAPMGPDVPGYKLVTGVYGLSEGQPQEFWLATFFDIPQTDPYADDYQLFIADLNGDGSNDLILHLGGYGVFIFAEEDQS